MIIDTHAHLYYPELANQLDDILSRAKDNGVEKIIVPAVDFKTTVEIIKLSEKYEMIYAAIGIHPCDVAKAEFSDIEKIEKLIGHQKIVAIGETGLDYYWDKTNSDRQKKFFELQTELAKSYRLPVVIHTRDSIDDAIEIIKENHDDNLCGQFHCFSGSKTQLDEILAMKNFYVSYCGNITYKNFNATEVIEATPVERILSETDSPFLPPVPYRGKKNEPSFIIYTLEKISEIKNLKKDKLIKFVFENSSGLFFKR